MTSLIGKSCALAAAMLLAAAPAVAQIWIGQIVGEMAAQNAAAQREEACMTGTAMPPGEIEETRPTAYAAMTGYWAAAQRGGGANVAGQFAPDARTRWNSGGASINQLGLTSIADPFVGSGAVLDSQPIAYVRAGDGSRVHGQWRVRRGGALVGTYDAMFKRVAATWKLHQLTLVPATSYVEPVVQFCHAPGDVLPYRVISGEALRNYTAKQADKARIKADKARADAAKTAAQLNDPDPAVRARAAERTARATAMEARAVAAADAARNAITAHDLAKADAAAADAARSSAIAALAGR